MRRNRKNQKESSENSGNQVFEDEEKQSFNNSSSDLESKPCSEIDAILESHPDPETMPRSQSSALTDTLVSSKPFSKSNRTKKENEK
jgi:hypothetical protein